MDPGTGTVGVLLGVAGASRPPAVMLPGFAHLPDQAVPASPVPQASHVGGQLEFTRR
jgi:hypothetical protein